MQFSVREVADLLSVSEKTIYRWIQKGQIPAMRVGDLYRFNRLEILEWTASRRIPVDSKLLLSDDDLGEEYEAPSLGISLQRGGIFYRVGGEDRDSCLKAVVGYLRLPAQADEELLYQVLLARENLASTGVGDGIAVPRARTPIVFDVDAPQMTLTFLEKAVDFEALDGKPVYALFTIICPSVRSHLHLYSRLSFALRNPEFTRVLEIQGSREEILATVNRLEKTFVTRKAK